MRFAIWQNKEYLSDYLDSNIHDYDEDIPKWCLVKPKNILIKKIRGLYLYFNSGKRKKYFSFDIVEKYNEYKMSVVPEEVIGLPAIGFIESMACGCAYIGIDAPMYRDIGLIPGIHYIAYDGTLDGLKHIIEYYQNNPDELERIAKSGYDYVRKNLNDKTIAENFYTELEKMCPFSP
jgi:glycosyltransferase involved in cell wall biosynthesis